DGALRLYSLTNGRSTLFAAGQQTGIGALAFSGNGAFLASASNDGSIRIWRALPDLALTARLTAPSKGQKAMLATVRNLGGIPSQPALVTAQASDLTFAVRARLPSLLPGAARTVTLELGSRDNGRYRV